MQDVILTWQDRKGNRRKTLVQVPDAWKVG